ncbi:hypothetical protein K488DRAFT_39517, partial [Vararia minispora EC-137]
NLSFNVKPGQLCVLIVGTNDSGKSTVPKFIARVHDTAEGEICINGHNIESLKLADIHRTVAVLFQDFKLTVRQISCRISVSSST